MNDSCAILGIRFFAGDVGQAVQRGLHGGLVVAPAAPLLATLPDDAATREALTSADLALTDSGLMVLVHRALGGRPIPRVSGLKYLIALLEQPALRAPGAVFWIMPGEKAKARLLAWGKVPARKEDCYVAPFYGKPIDDPALVAILNERRPAHVIVCLGGGTQERLGHYLRARLDYRPGIHCIGAAIGFLTGDQAAIPTWADRFFSWLVAALPG